MPCTVCALSEKYSGHQYASSKDTFNEARDVAINSDSENPGQGVQNLFPPHLIFFFKI